MLRKSRKTAISSFLTALAAGFICSFLAYIAPNNRLDAIVYDQWMKFRADKQPHPDIAIVDIDEKSLKELGQWPWPRYLLADLIQRMLADRAVAIGLDLMLSESDRTSLQAIDQELRIRLGKGLDLDSFPPEVLNNDTHFAHMLKGKPVALGARAAYDSGDLPTDMGKENAIGIKVPPGTRSPSDTVPHALGLTLPLKQFREQAPVGFINSGFDNDGIMRIVPLVIRVGDNLYASLALRTLMLALKRKTMQIGSTRDGHLKLYMGPIRATMQEDGVFRPVFRGPSGTFPYISASDVLSGSAGEQLKGKIVFVGSSAPGLVDYRASPLDPDMPGVEFQATIADNMLTRSQILIPYWAVYAQVAAIFFASFLAAAMFGFLPLSISAILGVLLSLGYFWASWRFFQKGLFLTPVYVVLATALCAAVIISLRFWWEQKGRRQIKQAFSRYVAPEAVARIAENGTRALEGEEKEISILFTDVRNFTTISSKMAPADIVRLLNSYFTPMTACVKARQGTLDKFVGDAMMAFWNAPLDVPGHQQQAVLAALDMQRKLAELRPEFMETFYVELRMGVGIHCGDARVGNMGSLDLLDYTCIGDNVNLASRLEGLCKTYGADIVVSSYIANKVPDIKFRPLDRVRVKGSQRALEIYLPLDPQVRHDMANEKLWEESLTTYFAGNFHKAAEMFRSLMEFEAFTKAANLFAERCDHLSVGQPKNWDGVFTYTTK